MAKTKRTKRYYRPKGRWSANIHEVSNQQITATTGNWSGTSVLATNPVQNTLGVSQTYTVKNMEVNFNIEGGNNTGFIEAVTCYIMYVPQGMTVTQNYNLEHPEYILTYKYLGSPTIENTAEAQSQNYQPIKIKSRLSRRLQTGDSIILFIKGFNENNGTLNIYLSGIIRWWTKAN